MIRSFSSTLLAIVALVFYAHVSPIARAADVVPPDITNVEISSVGQDTITIKWKTDEDSDSTVNYGLQEDYGIVRIPEANQTDHVVTIKGLEAGRTYYFRVVSADAEGNQGISANYKVLTDGTPQSGADSGKGKETQTEKSQTVQTQSQSQSQSQSESQTTQDIVQKIEQIQSPEKLREILNETVKAIQGISEDLTIVGPPTVIPETTSAIVKWTTDRESSSEVRFSSADSYTDGQYQFSQASTEGNTKQHEVRVIGLDPYTEYHFMVRSTDAYDITGSSLDYTFRTKAALPDIKNLHIVKVEENSATLAWDTTVPAKALIEYQDLSTGAQSSIGRPTLASTHLMRIADLTLGTRYVAFVTAENAGGDRVKSSPITFVTVKDTAPPIISNVTNDSTIFPGGESRIQTIIEWLTDEPSHCALSYREGIAGGVDPKILENKDSGFTSKHVQVIIDFAPATVYQFWLNCADQAGNKVKSENYVLFTPIQEKSIIDIILENFQSTFGWLKNINGKGGG